MLSLKYLDDKVGNKMKIFEIEDLQSLKKIIGLEIYNIFYQRFYDLISMDDIFVINFSKEENLYSFHVPCFVRILKKNSILLTSSDIYFSSEHKRLTTEDIEHNKENLLDIAIKDVNEQLKNSIVVDVFVNTIGDVDIKFSNDMVIQIQVDCRMHDYEFYRFIQREYNTLINHVIKHIDGKICYLYSIDLNIED